MRGEKEGITFIGVRQVTLTKHLTDALDANKLNTSHSTHVIIRTQATS